MVAGSYLIDCSDTKIRHQIDLTSFLNVSFVFLFVGWVTVLGHRKNDEKGCADGAPWWEFMSSDVNVLASVITHLS